MGAHHGSDWRREINWLYLKAFFAGHCILWSFGIFLWALVSVGSLSGESGKLLGIMALLAWLGSLLGLFPLVAWVRGDRSSASLSSQTWGVIGLFLLSSVGFLILLVQLELGKLLFWS